MRGLFRFLRLFIWQIFLHKNSRDIVTLCAKPEGVKIYALLLHLKTCEVSYLSQPILTLALRQ